MLLIFIYQVFILSHHHSSSYPILFGIGETSLFLSYFSISRYLGRSVLLTVRQSSYQITILPTWYWQQFKFKAPFLFNTQKQNWKAIFNCTNSFRKRSNSELWRLIIVSIGGSAGLPRGIRGASAGRRRVSTGYWRGVCRASANNTVLSAARHLNDELLSPAEYWRLLE